MTEIDICTSYETVGGLVTAYQCTVDSIRKVVTALSSVEVRSARFSCQDGINLITVQSSSSCYEMSWTDGDQFAVKTLKARECSQNSENNELVKINSDEFLKILGYAEGIFHK